MTEQKRKDWLRNVHGDKITLTNWSFHAWTVDIRCRDNSIWFVPCSKHHGKQDVLKRYRKCRQDIKILERMKRNYDRQQLEQKTMR